MWQLYTELHIDRLNKDQSVLDNYLEFLRGCSKRKILDIMGINEEIPQDQFFYRFIIFAKSNNLPAFIKFVEDVINGNGK
jgi:hypothetical protein